MTDALDNALQQHGLEAKDGKSGLVLRHNEDGQNWAFPWKRDGDRRLVMVECQCEPDQPHGIHWVDVKRLTDGDLSGRKLVGEPYHGVIPGWLVEQYA